MQVPSPTPRWPLYEKRCRDWTQALKQTHGEFRRDGWSELPSQFLVTILAATGAWVLWATTRGMYPPNETPWKWLMPTLGAALFGGGVFLGWNVLGVRYRFMHGEICEVSSRGHVRWREPLLTLQGVTFPWTINNSPQMLTLHWTTHQRTIELFPSIEVAVRDILRTSKRITSTEPPERSWRCDHCMELNPETFEVCWHCGTSAAARRQ